MFFLALSLIYLFWSPFPITNPQLIWMVLGERLGDGNFLYQDVIDDTGPLSAVFFRLVDSLLGRSRMVYEILGRIIIVFQIVYWSAILGKYRVFEENTYLPAVIMLVLFHTSFDLLILSPTLLGSSFLVLALGLLFSQTVLQKENSESTLLIGIYGGLAAGFYPNYVLFLPYMIVAGIAISGFSFRQLMLSLVGYFLPILLIGVYYFWNDGLKAAFDVWPLIFESEDYILQDYSAWIPLVALPILMGLTGYVLSAVIRSSTINQQKQRQLMVIWIIFLVIEVFFFKIQAAYQLVIFIPGLTYLIMQFFIFGGKGIFAKISLFLLVLGMPIFAFWYSSNTIEDNPDYFVKNSPPLEYPGTVMILGEDLSPFLKSKMGGPFLNYKLSKLYIEQDRDLPQRAELFQLLQTEKADVILDPNGLFAKILEDYPELKKQYTSPKTGVYLLK